MKMRSAFIELLHEDGRTEINKGTKRHIFVDFLPKQLHNDCILLLIAAHTDTVLVTFSVLLYNILNVQLVYGLYSLQLNCTYSNYTEAVATCSAAQKHSTFTVQILYKLYSLQMNCTYSNYTEADSTCSPVQQHSTFTVHILYKLYSLQLNCTYSNYT